jgi:mutator protein MutT
MDRLKIKIAVYIFLIKEGQILMARRFNTGWQDGNYGLPAGHLESGESLVNALLREVKEESGVDLNINDVELVHTMHRKNKYMDLFFIAKKWSGEPKIMEEDKCDDMKWFPLSELPTNIVPSVKFAIENYQNGIIFSEFENEE